MGGALTGDRVLDLSRALAGPFCTQLLGDMGASVIKVESPDSGDDSRQWGPFKDGVSCYYASTNRNKRSIAVNLKHPEGIAIIRALAQRSDVLVENFRPGVAARLGLAYEHLAPINPGLVYCSISGFGPDGPRAEEPAYDVLMQAFAGIMSVTGASDGPPTRVGVSIADLTSALYAAFGIVTALYSRSLTGRGQKVETSLLEGQLSFLTYHLVGYLNTGKLPTRTVSGSSAIVPYQAFPTRDGYAILAAANDSQWVRSCQALGRPELPNDPRFTTNELRVANRDALERIVSDITSRLTTDEVVAILQKAGVPSAPVNTVDRAVNDPQVEHLGLIRRLPMPELPTLRVCGCPVHLLDTPGDIQCPPPGLGQHTAEVLAELGYDAERIHALVESGAVLGETNRASAS